MESFEAYTAQISQEYYDVDHALWNADGARIRTLDLMSQLMDEYLPIMDEQFKAQAADETLNEIPNEIQNALIDGPTIHYVWEKEGVLQSSEDISALPATMEISYMLDGNAISVQELAGKSGQLEMLIHVERKATADYVYGVTALVHLDAAQCENLAVNGGMHKQIAEEFVCMGSAWLGGTENIYEMQLRADVTNFDPAKYMVVINPVHVDGGGDDSLDALLATAGELTDIINEGILLYNKLVEMQGYLANMESTLAETGDSVKALIPAEGEIAQDDAGSIMQNLLADAETDADAMLTAFGYEVAADATSADRVQMLSEAAADAERTEEEKAQASRQMGLIENYLVVVGQMEETQQAVSEINDSLAGVTENLPELVDAYAYANDQLYSILYKISTLYQNLANYYHANNGGGDYDFAEFGDWYDVIVFSNYDGITAP